MKLTIISKGDKCYICINGEPYIECDTLTEAVKLIEDYKRNGVKHEIYKSNRS
jgi:hypothetical protein